MNTHTCIFDSPIGHLRLICDDDGAVKALDFLSEPLPLTPIPEPCRGAIAQLDEYFRGDRTAFDLELRPEGTEFQQRVWMALRDIPYGETISYGEQARRLGAPQASRAVGHANGQNPIPIIVPCHRVVASDGRLTGFGGGLPVKKALLELEGVEVSDAMSIERPKAQQALPLG